jgi:cell division protein FtsQ
LTQDQRLLLPEQNPVQALERVLVLNQAQELLERDLRVVDLRLPNRPTLRLGPVQVTKFYNPAKRRWSDLT